MISFNGILIILAVILVLWLIDKYVASGLRALVRDWKKSHIIQGFDLPLIGLKLRFHQQGKLSGFRKG